MKHISLILSGKLIGLSLVRQLPRQQGALDLKLQQSRAKCTKSITHPVELNVKAKFTMAIVMWLIVQLWLITKSHLTLTLAVHSNPPPACPLLVRRLSGRITALMSVRLLLMEALASSNMADMPLINLIGKSFGCLACCITSAHPSPHLHSISPHTLVFFFYKANHIIQVQSKTLLEVWSPGLLIYSFALLWCFHAYDQ